MSQKVSAALPEARQELERDRAERDTRVRAVIEELRAFCRGPVRADILYDDQGQPRL